jgi:hypothetical protein
MKTKKKYDDGGKVTGADIRNAKKAAKLKRIEAGTEPSGYEKAATITGNVAKVAGSAAEVANAVRDTRSGMTGPGGMKKGGAVKKYQGGGRVISEKAAARKSAKGKGFTSSVMGPNPSGDKGKYVPFTRQGRKDAKETGRVSSNEMKPSRQIMKTGGMVNSNAKVSALKSAGSHGVKSGVNPKAAASKVARGKVGGTSSAPKTAVPKAKYGMVMRKK